MKGVEGTHLGWKGAKSTKGTKTRHKGCKGHKDRVSKGIKVGCKGWP